MHGVFGMSDNWSTLGRRWSEEYRVHLIDMRNHGRSPHSEDFSYELMAQDIADYFEQQGLDRAFLLGHSMGGKVAMLFATLNPEKTEKLVVADIAPKPYDPHHDEVVKALRSLDLSQVDSRKDAEEQFSKDLDQGTRQFLLKNLHRTGDKKLDWRFNMPVLTEAVQQRGEAMAPNAIYEGPTLFVRGGASPYIKEDDLEEIHAHFPQAKLETIDGAGHWLHAQEPEEFFETVSDFLSA